MFWQYYKIFQPEGSGKGLCPEIEKKLIFETEA
jgi:hypothetical protein